MEEARAWLLERLTQDVRMRSGPVDAAAWMSFDLESTCILRQIVDRHGWPGRSLVGEDGATAAWLLAQHSPDLAFQKEVLDLLQTQAEGEIVPEHVAFLHDRSCIREGRPQRYGTQIRPDGTPFPLEPGAVDARRAAVGLEPPALYLRRFESGQ